MKPSRFHSLTVLSAEVVASCWQSGLMRHFRMNWVWAFSLCRGSKWVVREAPACARFSGGCEHLFGGFETDGMCVSEQGVRVCGQAPERWE